MLNQIHSRRIKVLDSLVGGMHHLWGGGGRDRMGASGSYWQTNWQPMGAWPKVVSVFDCRRKLNMADFDIWIESWKRGSTRWHEGQVNAMLEKHAQDLTSGRTNLRVFVPMCGKSVDLLWLTDNGHTVVGVELAEIAVKSFFEETNLSLPQKP